MVNGLLSSRINQGKRACHPGPIEWSRAEALRTMLRGPQHDTPHLNELSGEQRMVNGCLLVKVLL